MLSPRSILFALSLTASFSAFAGTQTLTDISGGDAPTKIYLITHIPVKTIEIRLQQREYSVQEIVEGSAKAIARFSAASFSEQLGDGSDQIGINTNGVVTGDYKCGQRNEVCLHKIIVNLPGNTLVPIELRKTLVPRPTDEPPTID